MLLTTFAFEALEKFLDKSESVFVVSVDVSRVFPVNPRIVGHTCWLPVNISK